MYPYSRGHIHITGPELHDPLDFRLGFFTDPGDVDIQILKWGYKNSREVMRRTQFYRGEVASSHPRFPLGSKAAVVDDLAAPLFSTPQERDQLKNIEYTPEDDEAIESFLREKVQTTWHSLGTNKMAAYSSPRLRRESEKKGMKEEDNEGSIEVGGGGGVVDAQLNVYGVKGLKVVDLSVAPGNIGGNTNNTAMVIGEKGADIIAGELWGAGLSFDGTLC